MRERWCKAALVTFIRIDETWEIATVLETRVVVCHTAASVVQCVRVAACVVHAEDATLTVAWLLAAGWRATGQPVVPLSLYSPSR